MKKILALLLLVSATPLLAQQQIQTGQLKKKTDGGARGDSAGALYVGPYYGTSAPASPQAGQLWVDTTTTPPILKQHNGTTWVSLANNLTIPVQANAETFPGSPADGQVFYSKRDRKMFIYDGTAAAWRDAYSGGFAAPSVVLSFSGTTITDPTSAPTLTATGTGGSWTAGTHYCKYTWTSSTGGETLASPASTAVTTTAGQKIQVTLANGGGATAGKNIYCTGTASSVYQWVGAITDNTTTSATLAGRADGDALMSVDWKLPQPLDVNYSAPLPAGWTCINVKGLAFGGGCGSTGSSIIIRSGEAGSNTGSTSDTSLVAAVYDLTSYASSWVKVRMRVKRMSKQFPVPGAVVNGIWYYPMVGMVRETTSAGARYLAWGPDVETTSTSTAATFPGIRYWYRTTGSGGDTQVTGVYGPWPSPTNAIGDSGYHLQMVKKASAVNFTIGVCSSAWKVCQPYSTYPTLDEAISGRSSFVMAAALPYVGVSNLTIDASNRAFAAELDYMDIETW